MKKSFIWTCSVALAGFLFGFDTIVISGVDQQLQELWNSNDFVHGFVVISSALWGTVIGALFGGIPTDKYGRKNTLIGIGLLFILSALGSAFADSVTSFSIFRFIGGLGVGASTIAAPAYISEIAPAKKRGRYVALYQQSIVIGILIGLFSNYILQDMGEEPWRYMIGAELIPALLYSVIILFVPKSPRWLIIKGRIEEAKEIMLINQKKEEIDALIEEISKTNSICRESIFMKKYRFPLLLAFFIAFFNQFSGINALLYYAPRIFEEAGLGRSIALLSSVGIGVVNVVFTLIGIALIDRIGRKKLMYFGSIGYIISLSCVALSFQFQWDGNLIPIFLFLFIASHAIGQGTVIWVFIAEIFPNHLRASGQAFGSSVHWILAALIPSFIPSLFSSVGAGIVFAIFAVMMIGQLIWTFVEMPETKGESLEDLSRRLSK